MTTEVYLVEERYRRGDGCRITTACFTAPTPERGLSLFRKHRGLHPRRYQPDSDFRLVLICPIKAGGTS